MGSDQARFEVATKGHCSSGGAAWGRQPMSGEACVTVSRCVSGQPPAAASPSAAAAPHPAPTPPEAATWTRLRLPPPRPPLSRHRQPAPCPGGPHLLLHPPSLLSAVVSAAVVTPVLSICFVWLVTAHDFRTRKELQVQRGTANEAVCLTPPPDEGAVPQRGSRPPRRRGRHAAAVLVACHASLARTWGDRSATVAAAAAAAQSAAHPCTTMVQCLWAPRWWVEPLRSRSTNQSSVLFMQSGTANRPSL